MDLNLRPEHWVLVAILAIGVAVLGLQMGQDWVLPEPGKTAPEAAAVPQPLGATPEAPLTGPEEPGSQPSAPAAAAPPGSAHPPGPSQDSGPPRALEPRPGPGVPALTLKIQPDAPDTQQPVIVVVELANASTVNAVHFDLVHDAAALAFPEGHYSAVSALYGPEGEPLIEVRAAAPGRLSVSVRRRSGDPLAAATGELFAIEFKPLKPGRSHLRISNAALIDGAEARVPASGVEAIIDVR